MQQAMKYTIHSEIQIAATPEQVWQVFGDFAGWGKWNDFCVLPVVPERVGKRCRAVFYLDSGCMKQSPHNPEVGSDSTSTVHMFSTAVLAAAQMSLLYTAVSTRSIEPSNACTEKQKCFPVLNTKQR